jgi:kynurenine formamidase
MPDIPSFKLVDLSPPLDMRTALYPGDPPFAREWHCTLERDGANVSRLALGAHTGSHVDAPLHFLANGADVTRMGLAPFFGPAVVIDAPKAPGEDVTRADLPLDALRPGEIVLFRTGWEERSGTPRFFADPWPGITLEAVEALLGLGVKAVGGDLPSADGPAALEAGAPAHRRLAEAGVPIFECLVGLGPLVGQRFLFAGFPLKISGGEASPIRAVALLP